MDPETGVSTIKIEGTWNLAKARNRRQWGTHRSLIDSYLCEFMWRRHNKGKDLFDVIISDIVMFNPLK